MRNKEKILDLLDQILDEAKRQDEIDKLEAIKNHKGERAVGESWLVHHLKNLRELIDE